MKRINSVSALVLLVLAACGGAHGDLQCEEDKNCDLAPGGICSDPGTGHRWCAYPDSSCPSGDRYSNVQVGDNVAGTCIAQMYTLNVSVGGHGDGSVVSTPPGISCARGTCTGRFLAGTQVQLAATATTGQFLGWSNDCNGSGACAVDMSANRNVGALFGMPGDAIWLSQMSTNGGNAWPAGMAIDRDGDIVVVGRFAASINIGSATLASAGGNDIFVAKLNGKTGDLIWIKQFGGTDDDEANTVAIDSTNAVYVGGDYRSTSIDFGDGPLSGTPNREASGFVVKLGADGTPVWSHNLAIPIKATRTNSGLAVLGLSAGATGIAISGQFSGTATVNGIQFTSAGNADIFVAKLGLDGSSIWAKTFGGTGDDFGYDVAIDNNGDVVCAGAFQGMVNFGGGTRDAGSSTAALLLKLASADGAHLFSERFGSTTAESEAYTVAVDSSNSIFLAGGFWGNGDFGNGVPLVSSFAADPFVAKYSASGVYTWARSFSSTGHSSESAVSAAVDSNGDVAVTGSFCGNLSLGAKQNLVAASLCPTGVEPTDMFVVRMSGIDGVPLAYSSGGGVLTDRGNAVALAPDGRIFVTGQFQGFAEFGGATLTAPNSGYDAFAVSLPAL